MRVAVCAIAKLENKYLREWVEHYYALGVDNIIFFDNNDPGRKGEKITKVIGDYIKSGFVIVEDAKGKKKWQHKAFNYCYRQYGDRYDWIGFFDIDEFLRFKSHQNVKEYISQEHFNGFNCIKINWRTYDDNDLLRVKKHNYSITRFTRTIDLFNDETKCFLKTNIPEIRINSSHGALDLDGFTDNFNPVNHAHIIACNSAGHPCENISVVKNLDTDAYIDHYWFKTLEEFILNKKKRGDIFADGVYRKDFFCLDTFYWINKKTDEKDKYYHYLMYVYSGNTNALIILFRKLKYSIKNILKRIFPYNTIRGKFARRLYRFFFKKK